MPNSYRRGRLQSRFSLGPVQSKIQGAQAVPKAHKIKRDLAQVHSGVVRKMQTARKVTGVRFVSCALDPGHRMNLKDK